MSILKRGMQLSLKRDWIVGDQIGSGGFGKVYVVTSGDEQAVAKFVPKDPGAERELLFVELDGVRNVVPISDSGETNDEWVIVMPRADKSLSQYLSEAGGTIAVPDAVSVLGDIATALEDLEGNVVHRDLKPDNVLLLHGAWCLADFGISRYAEVTTAADTRKYALSAPYAAPERWRIERATGATDIYSLGVIGYEMLSGSRPFLGPEFEDYREQHLHRDPPDLPGVTPLLGALLEECLYKAPGARPSAANFLTRLSRIQQGPQSGGLARLAEANQAEVSRRATASRQESQSRSVEEVRQELAESAGKALTRIVDGLRDSILAAAPSVTHQPSVGGWTLRLNQATLRFSGPARTAVSPWQGRTAPFDVVCHAKLSLEIPENYYQYQGRGHSVWFCDAQAKSEYAWFETAFMVIFSRERRKQNPFALDPGEESGLALGSGLASYQVAWPFTRLEAGQLDDFIDRWASWFASAAGGTLSEPGRMPEGTPEGTWRQG